MTAIVKPDFEYIWSSEGGSKVPEIGQILSGWRQNQFPPSEVSNFLQNKVETAIQYIYQVGIPEWDTKIEYQVGSLVKYGGIHYISKTVNLNKMPSSSNSDWVIAWDQYGASNDIRNEVARILAEDGYLPHYVRKSNPVMSARAKAPSFEADVGATGGYVFQNVQSGLSCIGGDLIFTASGKVSARVKPDAKLDDADPLVVVNVGMVQELIANIQKAMQLPIGYTVITRNRKPPSEKDQLGYGVWELDVQGRALVGVSIDTAVTTPEWVKDADAKEGEYKHKMTVAELVPHVHPIGGRWQDGGSGGVQGGNKSVEYVTSTNETGGGEPFNIVQPSQTKFLWTRVG